MSSHLSEELSNLITEKRNPRSTSLDQMPTLELLRTINQEDQLVARAVEAVIPQVEKAVDHIYEAFLKGGRLFYVGAGTSGRLGVLDASECPPTFNVAPDRVQAILAGGTTAFGDAKEASEDNETQGGLDLNRLNVTPNDVVIGITASGRTPYPIGALKKAKEIGCYTVSLTCNPNSAISEWADCPIEVIVGPEVLTGSTRMKSGTAHKLILNMISTAVMVKWGKVYENLMVDVRPTNEKLRERAKKMVMESTSATYEIAERTLEQTNWNVKCAIVLLEATVSEAEAQRALREKKGNVRAAILYAKTPSSSS